MKYLAAENVPHLSGGPSTTASGCYQCKAVCSNWHGNARHALIRF
jgi:hypothetical protein